MLCKRIIPCLDIKDGKTVKGINFLDLIDAGNPVELAAKYALQGADELVLLDITATLENRATLLDLVKNVARQINIPFTVGGGISCINHVSKLLYAGADKISINSAAVLRPGLIDELAKEFGNQCIVVAIDTRKDTANQIDIVHTHGGKKPTSLHTQNWAKEVENRGAGEILLTSMDADGTKRGFDIDICAQIASDLAIPVIASGGAGQNSHFSDLFSQTQVAAGLAASIFHFGEINIIELKKYLINQNIIVRSV